MPDQKKYRLKWLAMPSMFDDKNLTFTERGVLGYLSTKLSAAGYPAVTADEVPLCGLTRTKMAAVLDRLVETGWAEVVE